MADKNDQTKEERPDLKPIAPTNSTPQFNPEDLTLIPMIDPQSGFWGLLCSDDNGSNWKYEYGPGGKRYHQRDINRISEIPFKRIMMKSPDGTAFYLSVSNDGQPVFTKVKKEDDSQ